MIFVLLINSKQMANKKQTGKATTATTTQTTSTTSTTSTKEAASSISKKQIKKTEEKPKVEKVVEKMVEKVEKVEETAPPEEEKEKKVKEKKHVRKWTLDDSEELMGIIKKHQDELTNIKHGIKDIIAEAQKLKKSVDADKEKKLKRKQQMSNNVNKKLYVITNDLADYMGLDQGTKVSRQEAIASVNKYVKANSLNGVEVTDDKGEKKLDKKKINMDVSLKKIFPNVKEGLEFTNIMKYIGQHFTDPGATQLEVHSE